VPYIARAVVQSILHVDEVMGWNVSKGGQTYNFFHRVETILSWNDIAKKVVSFMIFIFVIPKLLDMIDSSSQRQARQAATTTTKNSKEE
jgi:large-conductance mechanosensitive channel